MSAETKSNLPKKIYVLHETGFPSHYLALKKMCLEYGIELVFREFSVVGPFFKNLFKGRISKLKRTLVNLQFLLSLLASGRQYVVLGIAPFDYKLIFLRYFLARHKVFYHTSWTVWDGTFFPKKKFDGKRLRQVWKSFLEKEVAHIFSVTVTTKNQLLENYNLEEAKISVVYHSYETKFATEKTGQGQKQFPTFIYVGRLIQKKGILELLAYFKVNPDLKLTLVGDGELKEDVEKASKEFKNINFLGYVNDYQKLMNIYAVHDYFLLNSKRVNRWEELFGMVLIEAMSCGLVPIASCHAGPMEIISHNIDGYLVDENNFINFLEDIGTLFPKKGMVKMAYQKGTSFHSNQIKERWKAIVTS